ncbi:hypothetical protein STAFG_1126 [Streptomyces afghaniensis 772]|uniref:Uncharacterized protein n=1 Tax=Streptomyces afghaniensis 772 TaxID=1283301 RepID=S4MQL9_9ACTN|nr:hypothetical protein [Streptomyces afghaniensis]EPJ41833.1 hypothetical protein STAFG_1126 [Streptomyces afghaniensis 772]
MAFGVEELRVLRRALALALHPTSASADDVQDCLRLAQSIDEAMREGVRLRAFLVADLGRYRAALPGTAAGYLTLLDEALGAGYRPRPDDLAALRALRGNPTAAALLDRCHLLDGQQPVRTRSHTYSSATHPRPVAPGTPTIPASRSRLRLLPLPGGLSNAAENAPEQQPEKQPEKKPARKPAAPKPAPKPTPAPTPGTPKPSRPIPTPGEVFPRRKPTPPPPSNPQQLAAG